MDLLFKGRCETCPLAMRRGFSNPVNPKFHKTSPLKYLFIGEAPGDTEEETGEPFTGRSGQLLRTRIQAAKINIDECLFTNACWCAPNRDEKGKIGTPQPDEYFHCIPHSINLVRRYKPLLIVAVGGKSLNALTKPKVEAKITTVHGRFFTMHLTTAERYMVFRSWLDDFGEKMASSGLDLSKFPQSTDEADMLFQIDKAKSFGYSEDWSNIPMVPIIHPAFALRQGEDGKWAESITMDLQSAAVKIDKAYASDRGTKNYRWINTIEEAAAYADFVIGESKAGRLDVMSCDIETSEELGDAGKIGLLPLDPRVRILTMQFSHSPNEAVAFMVNHRESSFNIPDKFAELRTILLSIFENVNVVGHNFQFDAKSIRCRLGVRKFRLIGDTMLMFHWLEAGLGKGNGLNELGARLLDTGKHKNDALDWKVAHPDSTFEDMPLSLALDYAAGDADVTLQCYHILKARIQEENRWKEYFDHHHGVHGVWDVICDLEWSGMPIKKETLDHLSVIYPQMIDECLREMHANPFVLGFLQMRMNKHNDSVDVDNKEIEEYNRTLLPGTKKRPKKFKSKVVNLQEWVKDPKRWFNPNSPQQVVDLWKDVVQFRWAEIQDIEYNDIDSRRNPGAVGKNPSTDAANRKILLEYSEGQKSRCKKEAQGYWNLVVDHMEKLNHYKGIYKSNSSYVKGIYPLIIDKPQPDSVFDPNKRCYHLYQPYADFPRPWTLHPSFHLAGTETGRLASSDPNGQAFPSGEKIRREANVKDPYVSRWDDGIIIQPDYSQIEVRVLVMMAQESTMADAINRGEDVHKFVASIVHHCKPEEVTDDQRKKIKAITFGIIYGQSVASTAQKLGITVDEAQAVQDQLFARLPNLKIFMDRQHMEVRETGRVVIPTGRVCYIPHIRSDFQGEVNKALRNSVNAPIQGAASDLCAQAFGRTWKKLQNLNISSYPFSVIHDSQSFDIGPGRFFDAIELQYYEMVWAPYTFFDWMTVKPLAEFSIGTSWGGLVDVGFEFDEARVNFDHNRLNLSGYKRDVETVTETIKNGGQAVEILYDAAHKKEKEAAKGKWERHIRVDRKDPVCYCHDKKLVVFSQNQASKLCTV